MRWTAINEIIYESFPYFLKGDEFAKWLRRRFDSNVSANAMNMAQQIYNVLEPRSNCYDSRNTEKLSQGLFAAQMSYPRAYKYWNIKKIKNSPEGIMYNCQVFRCNGTYLQKAYVNEGKIIWFRSNDGETRLDDGVLYFPTNEPGREVEIVSLDTEKDILDATGCLIKETEYKKDELDVMDNKFDFNAFYDEKDDQNEGTDNMSFMPL